MLSVSRKSILKFEDMLKTNTNYYFDSTEFINIIHHYIDNANLDEDENEWLNLLKDKIDNIMQTQAKYDMECG